MEDDSWRVRFTRREDEFVEYVARDVLAKLSDEDKRFLITYMGRNINSLYFDRIVCRQLLWGE